MALGLPRLRTRINRWTAVESSVSASDDASLRRSIRPGATNPPDPLRRARRRRLASEEGSSRVSSSQPGGLRPAPRKLCGAGSLRQHRGAHQLLAAQAAPGAPQRQTPQAPSVAQAAQMAVKELPLTAPSVHLSVGDQAFVGVPVWLWIDRGTGAAGPLSATASAGAAQVTATGRLVAVEWSLGPAGCAGGVPGGGDAVARSGGGVTGLRLHLSTAVVARADGRLGTLAGDRDRRVAGRLDRVLGWGAGRGSADGAAGHADLAAGR